MRGRLDLNLVMSYDFDDLYNSGQSIVQFVAVKGTVLKNHNRSGLACLDVGRWT